MAVRLDKVLSELGVASRRELKQIIRSGRVSVNGQTVTEPEKHIDPEKDELCLDGAALRLRRFRYPAELRRLGLFPVGRLDKDTSGLLLLTNDGDFAHRVISPKAGVEKRYRAEVEGVPDEEDARVFAQGLILADGTRCLPAKLEITGGSVCFVTVMEGKYHQVKRMLASRGKPVRRLRRLSVGELEIGEALGPGGFRELEENDLCKVLKGFCVVN